MDLSLFDHAPKDACLNLQEIPYERALLFAEALQSFENDLERAEQDAMACHDERREVRLRQKQAQVRLTREWLLTELHEDADRSGYIPTAADRAESRIEDERGEAA
jgi:hypothetical protein